MTDRPTPALDRLPRCWQLLAGAGLVVAVTLSTWTGGVAATPAGASTGATTAPDERPAPEASVQARRQVQAPADATDRPTGTNADGPTRAGGDQPWSHPAGAPTAGPGPPRAPPLP